MIESISIAWFLRFKLAHNKQYIVRIHPSASLSDIPYGVRDRTVPVRCFVGLRGGGGKKKKIQTALSNLAGRMGCMCKCLKIKAPVMMRSKVHVLAECCCAPI